MKPLVGVLISGLLLPVAFLHAVYSQEPGGQKELSPQQQSVLVMLANLAVEVRSIADSDERVRIIAAIADLVWPYQPDTAREYFQRAFRDASEDTSASDEDRESVVQSRLSLKRELVRLLSRHDAQLAVSLLNEAARPPTDAVLQPTVPERRTSDQRGSLYYLASELVNANPQLAKSVAERALASEVNWHTLYFLQALRRKNEGLASAFFISALHAVYSRRARNINELLTLYSYVFAPTMLIEASPKGLRSMQLPGYSSVVNEYPVDPELAASYLQTSARIMLAQDRFLPTPPDIGEAGDYFFITLLLPLCQAYLPSVVDSLERVQAHLGAKLQENVRMRLQPPPVRTSPGGEESETPSEADEIARLTADAEKSKDPSDRDRRYFRAVVLTVKSRKYDLAESIASRVSENMRASVRSFLNFMIASQALSDKDYETALKYARRDQDPARTSYLLMSVAHSLTATESARALGLLSEATKLAHQATPEKVQTSLLFGLTSVYAQVDPPRGLELLSKAVEAANKTKDFNSDRLSVGSSITVGGFGFFYGVDEAYFSFPLAFRLLSKDHFQLAAQHALRLENQVARAKAVVALCRDALEAKSTDGQEKEKPVK